VGPGARFERHLIFVLTPGRGAEGGPGRLLDAYEKLLGPRTKPVSFAEGSNAPGTVAKRSESLGGQTLAGPAVRAIIADSGCHYPRSYFPVGALPLPPGLQRRSRIPGHEHLSRLDLCTLGKSCCAGYDLIVIPE